LSFFQQIEKLGIPIHNLSALSEGDIIRIEKQLKAQARINDEINKNDVAQIIQSLRKDQEHISTLFDVDFDVLRQILRGDGDFVYMSVQRKMNIQFKSNFIQFLTDNFQNELNVYVENCFKESHYYGLYSLLRYAPVLSSEFLQSIGQRMEQKIVYMMETMRLGSEGMAEKIQAAANPFFYRCLNLLGAINYEADVAFLLNTTLEFVKDKRLYLRILFSIGSFESASESAKDVFAKNKKIAFDAGVREEDYKESQFVERGGTIIKKRSKADGESSYNWAWLIAVILIFSLRSILSDSNDIKRVDFNADDIWEHYDRKIVIQSNSTDQDFVDLMKYLHSDSIEIVGSEDIPFDLERTNLPTNQVSVFGNNRLDIKNDTEFKMVIIAQKLGVNEPLFYCLSPNEQIKVQPQLSKIRIYSGENPQLVDYIDQNGDTLNHFRFNTFTIADMWNFDILHNVYTINGGSGKKLIRITMGEEFFSTNVTRLNNISL
jgi:hypothetical protein